MTLKEIPLHKPASQLISYPAGSGNELFQAIQDPVLVVTPEGIIIDANHAALTAAKKSQDEIIGKGICTIIHGGSLPHLECPLEEFLRTKTSRVEETTLPDRKSVV